MQKAITVVVCTFNRARLLSSCLGSLVDQTLPADNYEVIIVDNNSTDATSKIAAEAAAMHTHFRVVVESRQGLSHARNRGWVEAHGRFVAYIDDDAKANPDWLAQMMSFIERHPTVKSFGGPASTHTEVPLPAWFPPEYGIFDLGDRERPITVGSEFLYGPNMVFERGLLKELGGFNPELGMNGVKVSYGEETRLVLEIAGRGFLVYYVPSMQVSHLIATAKLRLRWLLHSSYCNGRCAASTFNRRRTLASHLYGVMGESFKAPFRLIQGVQLPFKRNIYQAFAGFCAELGALVDYLSTSSRRPD